MAFKILPNLVTLDVGGWNGKQARLQFRQYEFKACLCLQFFCKFDAEKNKNKQKEAGVGPLKIIMHLRVPVPNRSE